MNIIYHWIGFAFVWISVVVASLVTLTFLYETILNWIGRRFKSVWGIVEFQIYKKDFKEWVKDKQRHKKLQ